MAQGDPRPGASARGRVNSVRNRRELPKARDVHSVCHALRARPRARSEPVWRADQMRDSTASSPPVRVDLVEASAPLGQLRGREIDADDLLWKIESGVDQCAAYAFAAFFHAGLGETHHADAGQTTGQMDLDVEEATRCPPGCGCGRLRRTVLGGSCVLCRLVWRHCAQPLGGLLSAVGDASCA